MLPWLHVYQCCFGSLLVVVLYAVTAVYFAGVMVRLMLTLTPIVCILASIAFSRSLDNYMKPMFPQLGGGGERGGEGVQVSRRENSLNVLEDWLVDV